MWLIESAEMTEIVYFEARARVEPIRVLLEELAISYDDQRLSFEDWVELKPSTPFGALPSYGKGDIEIFQSHAIIRHLARVHDLYGSTEVERIRCDMIEAAISDLNELVGKAPWRPDFKNGRVGYVENELGPVLVGLERFLMSNVDSNDFWVGSSLTFVDLIAFAVLDNTRVMFPEAFEQCSLLVKFCDLIASRPRIAAYITSGRRPEIIQHGPDGPIYDNAF
jgi:glutathione S-transferase